MAFVEVIRWVKISPNALEFKKKIPQQKMHRMSVGKFDICLTRYDETVYAFENRCPHQLMELSKGICSEDKKVICPWHRFAFSLEDGKGGGGLYMEIFPIKEEENQLFIGFKKMTFKLFGK